MGLYRRSARLIKIGQKEGNGMEQEQLYERLLDELKKTGKLCLRQRKELWKCFRNNSVLGSSNTNEKEIRLGLWALTKAISTSEESKPFFAEIRAGVQYINQLVDDTESLRRSAENLYKLVREEMEGSDDDYIIYMMQAFRSFIMMIEGDPDIGSGEDGENILDDGDLEFEELDTSYCSCVLWTYQDPSVSTKIRKRREQRFWECYIREAALLQGVMLKETRDDRETDNEAEIRLESIGDFVQYVSYEMEYLDRCEKKEAAKEIKIYVYNLKNGTRCPTCGKFSDHISASFNGIMKFGKIKGWNIIFDIKENICKCDNPDCPENDFMPTEEVDYKEKIANYKYIKSIPGNEEKLCKLLEIPILTHKKK